MQVIANSKQLPGLLVIERTRLKDRRVQICLDPGNGHGPRVKPRARVKLSDFVLHHLPGQHTYRFSSALLKGLFEDRRILVVLTTTDHFLGQRHNQVSVTLTHLAEIAAQLIQVARFFGRGSETHAIG